MKQMLIVGFLMIAIVISGCSAQKTQVQPTNVPSAGEVQQNTAPSTDGLGIREDIDINGFAFNPSPLTIPKGATVIWTNMDSAPHTIVSDFGDELNSDSISKGKTYAHTFSTPGTYDYHCGIHPSMKGKIVVK